MTASPMTSRTILVTGASRGIGAALVPALRLRGHRVIGTARRPDPDGDLVRLDTTDPASCAVAVPVVAERLEGAPLDVVLNNAGIKAAPDADWEASAGPLERVEPAAVAAVLGTNVIGPLNVTRALLPLLGAGSVVVNVSSQLGSFGVGVDVDYAYNASKAALNMVTVTMQRDLGARGVAAVSLNPGWIRTEMGGAEAPLDLDDAVADIAGFLGEVDASWGGRFVDRLGEPVPW